ncbi:MAG: DUF4174 domain-containing protein [Acidobacteriaceae bacterium]
MSRTRRAAAALALLLAPLALYAQAKLTCKVQPATLAEAKDCWRPLLVFSPTDHNPQLIAQEHILDRDADDMMDRFVLLVPVVPHAKTTPTPLDAPWTIMPQAQMDQIRARFHIPDNRFQVILLDEEGDPALRSSAPIPTSRLKAIIHNMPHRKIEKQRRGAN